MSLKSIDTSPGTLVNGTNEPLHARHQCLNLRLERTLTRASVIDRAEGGTLAYLSLLVSQ